MLGASLNTLAVIAGTLLGLALPNIPERMKTTVMHGLALTVLLIGLSMALADSKDILIIIMAMVIGGVLGEWLSIEQGLYWLGKWLERKTAHANAGNVAQAFVTASLVFCVGSMAIVGAIQSGLADNQSILIAKSMLDFTSSVVFTSTLGFGVIFSAIPLFLYEGGIATGAHFAGAILQNPGIISALSATGGLLISAIGMNLLGIRKLAVGNLLPALVVAPLLKWAEPTAVGMAHAVIQALS
ncbi:DUF554 domain-containing protein [Alicyclobacillaceae bacterium I2511]|nr:DUF554 domain-containing protein [Alicyclobacillaceae bacterium I2511]